MLQLFSLNATVKSICAFLISLILFLCLPLFACLLVFNIRRVEFEYFYLSGFYNNEFPHELPIFLYLLSREFQKFHRHSKLHFSFNVGAVLNPASLFASETSSIFLYSIRSRNPSISHSLSCWISRFFLIFPFFSSHFNISVLFLSTQNISLSISQRLLCFNNHFKITKSQTVTSLLKVRGEHLVSTNNRHRQNNIEKMRVYYCICCVLLYILNVDFLLFVVCFLFIVLLSISRFPNSLSFYLFSETTHFKWQQQEIISHFFVFLQQDLLSDFIQF